MKKQKSKKPTWIDIKKSIKAVCKMTKKKQEPFRKRLEKIMKSADGIGWGYYDDLCHFYHEAFE